MGLQEEIIYMVVVFIISILAYVILSMTDPLYGLIGFLTVWGVYGFIRITISGKL
jgi:hypothetical protein